MKNILFAALSVFTYTSVSAQTFAKKNIQTQTPNLVEIQKRFDAWSQNKNLSNEKGWKYYKRWENEYAKYANGKGDLPSPYNYLNALQQAASTKNSSAYKAIGSSWSPVGPFNKPNNFYMLDQYNMGRINCVAFHPTDTNTLFVGVGQGGIWKTTNHGQTWAPLTDNTLPILRISDIAIDPADPNIMYASVGDYSYIGIAIETDGRKRNTHYGLGVYKSTDGGNTWNPTGLTFALTQKDGSLSRKVVIDPSNTQNLVAATTAGVFKSTNGGLNWIATLDSLMWDLEQDPNNPTTLYAASGYLASLDIGSAAIWKSTDFGSTWTELNTGIIPRNQVQRLNISISRANSNYVYVIACDLAGGFGGLYRTTNGGTTWSEQSTSPNILHWYDGNAQGGQGTYDLAILADPVDTNRVYIGGININRSDDGGVTWTQIENDTLTPYVHVDQHYFDYNPLSSKYYFCNDGGIYYADSLELTDNKIISISDGLAIRSFYRVGLCDDYAGFVISGAHDNGTAIRDTTGQWTHLFGGDGMKGLIHPHDPQKIYFSYQYGQFYMSDNFGVGVSFISVGGNERGEWTTPMIFHPNNPDTMYSAFGNVWRSTDGGNNWDTISTFDTIPNGQWPNPSTAITVAPSNTNYIYLTKRVYHQYNAPSEAWISKDNGDSWMNITVGLPDTAFLMDVEVSAVDPNIAWVVCAGLFPGVKVFKTIDAGVNWTNISYNLPNVPVNAIVTHKGTNNNAIYVATDMGVYYLNDNLSTWQTYNTNLPNVIVTDVEIHNKTQKLWASTFGRGMWMSDLQDDLTSVSKNTLRDVDAQILPNVNSGEFALMLNGAESGNYYLNIVDVTGKQVWSKNIFVNNSVYREQIKLQLQSGVYFMLLNNNNAQKALKFVIQ